MGSSLGSSKCRKDENKPQFERKAETEDAIGHNVSDIEIMDMSGSRVVADLTSGGITQEDSQNQKSKPQATKVIKAWK